ncbi:histamine H2 receptor-like [Lytechinus pictus]|uniref:histamine H2 receptor-like n=1 Tax=Lytechinus pictus TaxID=7653 RepID=UPI0030B9F17B
MEDVDSNYTLIYYQNDNDSFTNSDTPSEGYTRGVLSVIGIVLVIIIFATIFGNILVILSPTVNRRLRNVTNMFIVSLAVADLLLAILVQPFSGLMELRNQKWGFGAIVCNLYVSFDVQLCTASILHLFAISIDRYIAISDPMNYRKRLDRRKAVITITIVWAVSISISFLPLHLGWNTDSGEIQNFAQPEKCYLHANTYFALLDGLLLFYLPLTVMCCLYFRVLNIARNQARKINSQTAHVSAQYNGNAKSTSREVLKAPKPRAGVDEHRATKMLGVIMGSFIICWVPYFTIFTFIPLCNCEVPQALSSVALWLGYLNSTLNPILYAALNREFRRAFRKLLRLRRFKRHEGNTYISHLELSTPHLMSVQDGKCSASAGRRGKMGNGSPTDVDSRKNSRESRLSNVCLNGVNGQ